MKRSFRRYLILVFAIVFVASAYKAGTLLYQAHKEKQGFEALIAELEREKSEAGKPGSSSESGKTGETGKTGESIKQGELNNSYEPVKQGESENPGESGSLDEPNSSGNSAYQILKAKNSDYFGWLSIPGTKLNYPVMYTPHDPEYYIHRAFDGSRSNSGVPFVGEGWSKAGNHTIIYGHNMKNGTMFATLHSYADKAFGNEHPKIILETAEGREEYSLLASFYSEAGEEADSAAEPKISPATFRYYQHSNLSEQMDFEDYVKNVHKKALYPTDVEASFGGRLLTLSTCSYHKNDGRFVVVAYAANAG